MNSPDVALELPTGSGKTLVGLLIGEWRRRTRGERIAYACPTRQLAIQVASAAEQQGIAAHALVDSHSDWDERHLLSYSRSESIAITTYSHIFNSHSQFADAGTIIFDDAHAAENYVADAWALEIPKKLDAYGDLFDAMGPSIDPLLMGRMSGDGDDAATWNEVRLIPISAIEDRITEIDSVLSTGLEKFSPAWWSFRMIRENLGSCLFYVSRGSWYIRPMIPPTFQHEPFTAPNQRVYLSATLGEAGELERSFGQFPIERIPSPEAWERTGSGRRFFVFPELSEFDAVTDFDSRFAKEEQPQLVERLSHLVTKRLVLTQSSKSAQRVADKMGSAVGTRYLASEKGVADFRGAEEGTLLAANRYDGMDLAGPACRFEIMAGVPKASHLQDEFLSSKLRAREILAERIRTRVVQGAGRCARGPQDWTVVVVQGSDLLRYLSTPENTQSMPIDLQAEISFGLRASMGSFANVIALTRSALAQDEDWRSQGEERISEARTDAARNSQPLAAALSQSAPLEVRAWRAAWASRWEEAAQLAVDVLESSTHPDARAFRSLWAYFASAWYRRTGTAAGTERATDLLRQAHKAATGTVWLREVAPLPADEVDPTPSDASAVSTILTRLNGEWSSAARFQGRAQTMLGQLAQASATDYELGLAELGIFLGATSYKPKAKGRADAVWLWDELWITIEAKSEQTAELLSMDYVRQANTQLASLAADTSTEIPPDSVSVLAVQRPLVDPDAVPIANPNLMLVTVDVVLDIAHDAHRAITAIRSAVQGLSATDSAPLAAKMLWQHRVLATQVRDRLTRTPIRGS